MNVEVVQDTFWKRALNAARYTVHKEPSAKETVSAKWIDDMLYAEHSPIRLVEYTIIISHAFQFVIGHLVRHFIGCIPFVQTNRSDRTGIPDEKINRLTPTSAQFVCNAQSLINISRKRLCNCASKSTREAWTQVKEHMKKVDPLMSKHMVRECVYRGFCPEQDCCGYVDSDQFKEERENYVKKRVK